MIESDFMNIEKFFEPYNNSSIVFDPIPSYSGYWDFEIENLIKNSKKENGVNLFQQFIEDIYLKKIGKIFNINVVSTIPIRLLSSPNEDNVGRCLKFSKIPLYSNLQLFLNQSIDLYGKDKENHYKYLSDLFNNFNNNEKLNEDFINALKEKLLKLKDIKENGFESVYHDAVMEDFDFEKKVYPNLEFNQYINSMYKITEQYINGLMNIGDFFEQKIDYNELYKCFNPDTFYLLFAKIIYEISLRTEEECNLLDNSYGYLFTIETNYFFRDKGAFNIALEHLREVFKNNNILVVSPESIQGSRVGVFEKIKSSLGDTIEVISEDEYFDSLSSKQRW